MRSFFYCTSSIVSLTILLTYSLRTCSSLLLVEKSKKGPLLSLGELSSIQPLNFCLYLRDSFSGTRSLIFKLLVDFFGCLLLYSWWSLCMGCAIFGGIYSPNFDEPHNFLRRFKFHYRFFRFIITLSFFLTFIYKNFLTYWHISQLQIKKILEDLIGDREGTKRGSSFLSAT